MQHIIVDFEFTPVSKANSSARRYVRNEIIEIGAVRLDENYNYIDSFVSFVKPQYAVLNELCSKLTGVTGRDLKDAPCFEEAVDSFNRWIGDGEFGIYEWSNNDEVQFRGECLLKGLSEKFDRLVQADWIDIQKMFTDALGFSNVLSLEGALNAFNLIPEGRLHDAGDDAYNTAVLLGVLSNSEQLQGKLNSINGYMSAGAAAGSTLGDIFGDLFSELQTA